MRNMNANKFLAATSLVLTVAAFGCTTNRYPGNGEPTIGTPGYGAANRSATPGSSSGTEGTPPMASSYVGVPQPNTDAAAEAAAEQGYRGRVLGTVNPAGVQVAVPRTASGQVIPPAQLVNPQPTVNPSVSSPTGVPAITSDVSLAAVEALFLSAVGSTGSVVPTTVTSALATTAATATSSTTPSSMAQTNSINVGATPASGTVMTGPMTAKATTASTTARATTASSSVRAIPISSGLVIQQNLNGQILVLNMSSVPGSKASTTTPSVKP
jgi:hypothetical protein